MSMLRPPCSPEDGHLGQNERRHKLNRFNNSYLSPTCAKDPSAVTILKYACKKSQSWLFSNDDQNGLKGDDDDDDQPVGDDVLHARPMASRRADHVDPPTQQVPTHTHTGKNQ